MVKKRILIFILLLSISTVFLGIGYAAIDNITLDLSGNTSVKKNDSIKITNIEYVSDNLADTQTSKINNFTNTTISSKIVLGEDKSSTITYQVTLKNDTDITFKYADTIHSNDIEFYDNANIGYTVSGINIGDRIVPDEEKVITITFQYLSDDISNNTLNSFINIKFNKLFEITYENITDSNLINEIEEGSSATINFQTSPDEVVVEGDADYTYTSGVLNLSNVASDLKITGKAGTPVYTTTGGNLTIGSTIDPSSSKTEEEMSSTYMKYTVDSNNKVVKIESCKKASSNASAICLTGVDTSEYASNKSLITTYFGGSSDNLPSGCTEEYNMGATELTCANSYVVLAADSDGGIFINDIENKKSCVINPTFGIYSCK